MDKNTPLTVGILIVGVLAIPIALNSCGQYQERKALRLLMNEHVAAGKKALDANDFETSEMAFRSALSLAPANASAQNGLAHSRAGRIIKGNASTQRADAIRLIYEIERALGNDAANAATYRLALAELSGALGRKKTAQTWYQKATSSSGASARAWLLKGQYELGLGDAQTALTSFTQAIKLDSELGAAQLYMGDAYMKDAKLAEAAEAYQKATVMLSNASAWYRLGDVQLRQGEPAKAYKSLGKAADLHKTPTQDLNLMKRLGIAAYKVKRFDESVRFLTQAAKLDKTPDTIVNLSVAHQALNDHQTAIQMLGNVINQYPTNAGANLAAVTSLAYLNRREDAHRVGKKFIAFASSNPRLKQTAERISKILGQLPLTGLTARGPQAQTTPVRSELPRATAPAIQRLAPPAVQSAPPAMVEADAPVPQPGLSKPDSKASAPATASPKPQAANQGAEAIPQVLAPGDPGIPGHPNIPGADQPPPARLPSPKSTLATPPMVPAEP